MKRTPTEVRNAPAYVLLNARKHFRERRGRTPPVALDAASSGRWFDGWSTSPPAVGRYADVDRAREVATPRTWLLEKGWQRLGLIDPAEVPGFTTRRRDRARQLSWSATPSRTLGRLPGIGGGVG